MIKIWARVYQDDKTIDSCVYQSDEKYDPSELYNYMREICYQLDLPTPLVLGKHIRSLGEFITVKFKRDEFVEKVGFDFLLVENIA